jgi:hypothetical protein
MATSYVTPALAETRDYLKTQTGLDNFSLGIVNNETDASYHHGWSQRDTDGSDYSWDESSRDWSWKTNAARALDIGNFSRLRELSLWLVSQCEANRRDPRVNVDCADIREIIYSPDGKTVKRWDRLGIRTSGDPSHREHTHVSWFADAEHRSKVGPFKRFFGTGKAPNMMFLQIKGHQEVYGSDLVNTRAMPEGTWGWCQQLINSGVPFFKDLPDMATLLKVGGPLAPEISSGGLVQHSHTVESQSVFVAGSQTGAAVASS